MNEEFIKHIANEINKLEEKTIIAVLKQILEREPLPTDYHKMHLEDGNGFPSTKLLFYKDVHIGELSYNFGKTIEVIFTPN
jgi:hypothetical protein